MQKASLLENTAAAMKNIIVGYGDRYVVPTHSALDDLAEHFGFAEAGQRLKLSRERVRDMIKKGAAATCDYAEINRRATAIEFVLDAFNGKVDTILADVRDDNYGTLTQKIKDAFSVVNHNGAAFRNARINPEYLEARLDELRWAVAASELKEKEKEEQRALRERIREEERAQREYERAMKEAEKEEEMLRKAMEKVRKEVEKATDDQKIKYEHQLAELGDKLRAAEEKNQRALSMAQQTKAGHVYVISNIGSFGEHVYKIGLTRRLDPHERVRELGDASVPFDFDVHTMIRSDDAPALERELHKRFVRNQVNKVNARKEFFRVTLHDIRTEVERMGC
jgi:DNA repair exonuclease SbcCD ATPase subunit